MNFGYIFFIIVILFIAKSAPNRRGQYNSFTTAGFLIVSIPSLILFLVIGNNYGIDNTLGIVSDTITLNLGINDHILAGKYVAQKYGDKYEYSDNMNNYQKGYDAPTVYRVRPFSYNATYSKMKLIKEFTRSEIEYLEHDDGFSVFYKDIDIGDVIIKDGIFYDEYIFLFDIQQYNKFIDIVD